MNSAGTHLVGTETVARGELRLGTSGRVRVIIPAVEEVTCECRSFNGLEKGEGGWLTAVSDDDEKGRRRERERRRGGISRTWRALGRGRHDVRRQCWARKGRGSEEDTGVTGKEGGGSAPDGAHQRTHTWRNSRGHTGRGRRRPQHERHETREAVECRCEAAPPIECTRRDGASAEWRAAHRSPRPSSCTVHPPSEKCGRNVFVVQLRWPQCTRCESRSRISQ